MSYKKRGKLSVNLIGSLMLTASLIGCYISRGNPYLASSSSKVSDMSDETPVKVCSEPKNVCRLCSTSDNVDRFTHIFSKAGQQKEFSKKISYALGIQIEDDGFSTGICRVCERKLHNYYDFKVAAFKAQSFLRQNTKFKRCLKATSPTTLEANEERRPSKTPKARTRLFPPTEAAELQPSNERTIHIKQIEMRKKVLEQLEVDCIDLCSKKNPSILRQKHFDNMINLDWEKILQEILSRCPILYEVMTTVIKTQNVQNHVSTLCLCYGVLMQRRNHELSLIQRINTVLFSEGNASKQLLHRCQKLGVTLGHDRKIFLLDKIGGHFADKVIDAVLKGKKVQGLGDNFDMKIHAHDMRKDNQNDDLHYFNSCLVVERVPSEGLSTTTPQQDVKCLPNNEFLLNENEELKLKEDFKVLVGRVLVSFIPSLSFLKTVIPQHIEHRYTEEMSQKSTIIPLPMQMKDEKKYDDVVDILCEYENTIEDIYSKAGLIQVPHNNVQAQRDGSLSNEHSAPDQPGGHFNQRDDTDHMKGISAPFGGDQLTRVRFAGAKDLRRGCHTAKDRFDHVSPFAVELFHTKMSFVQLVYSYLYKAESIREVGTLKYFRERLNRKNVTPEKVTKSYEGCEQFLLSTGKAYLLEAAMEFWGMDTHEDKPTKNCPPKGILHLPLTKKKEYFDQVVGAFVDEYVMVDPDSEEIREYQEAEKQASVVNVIKTDHDYHIPAEMVQETEINKNKNNEEKTSHAVDKVRYYGLNIIELTVFLMQLLDTCAEGDGERCNINKKKLLLYFKRFGPYSKYALEMFVSIVQTKALHSEEMAHRLTWGRYVNWNGGYGKNIEGDCALEICNRTCKSVIKSMGPNKTSKAMMRASKASAGVQQIVSVFDKTTGIHKTSNSHSTVSSMSDEIIMLNDLRKLRPFAIIPHRQHRHFADLEMSPLCGMDMMGFYVWLTKHKNQIALEQ